MDRIIKPRGRLFNSLFLSFLAQFASHQALPPELTQESPDHRAGKVCTGLVYDRMCVRGLKVSWDFPYGKYRIFGPDLWGNFHFPLLNSFPLKIWSDSWNRGSHPAALHSLMCLSQNIYWASAMCRYGSPEKQN